ncbi:unnamed protein product [Merluccius merluccius]
MLLLTSKTDLNRMRPTWEKQFTQNLNRTEKVLEVRNKGQRVRMNMTWSSFNLHLFKRNCLLYIKRTMSLHHNLNIRSR